MRGVARPRMAMPIAPAPTWRMPLESLEDYYRAAREQRAAHAHFIELPPGDDDPRPLVVAVECSFDLHAARSRLLEEIAAGASGIARQEPIGALLLALLENARTRERAQNGGTVQADGPLAREAARLEAALVARLAPLFDDGEPAREATLIESGEEVR